MKLESEDIYLQWHRFFNLACNTIEINTYPPIRNALLFIHDWITKGTKAILENRKYSTPDFETDYIPQSFVRMFKQYYNRRG